MKKLFITVVMLALCAIIIIGCGQTATPASSPSPTTAPTTTAKPAPTSPALLPTSTTPVATPTAGRQQYGGALTILYNSGIPTMGTPWEGGPQWGGVGSAVVQRLSITDNDERIQPWLAESSKIAPDGKSVTFNLRKGVKFQDGTDFDADAVKYNLTSWPPGSAGAVTLKEVTSIDVLDKYTVRLNFPQFNALLILQLCQGDIGYMCSPTAAKKPTTPDMGWKDHLVGTGPFTMTEWKRDNYAKMQKWDGYWEKGKPYVDSVTFRNFADLTTMVIAFQAGNGQFIAPIQPMDVERLKAAGFTTGFSIMGFVMPIIPDASPKSPFANVKVREAVEYAIDKETMNKTLFKGYWPPAYQQALRDDAYFAQGLTPRVYNPDKAKQLLAEAGYPTGFRTKLHTDVRAIMDHVVAVQTYLKAVGIDAELDNADVPRMTVMQKQGWDGLLLPGAPNPSSTTWLANRFGTPSYYVNMYRPPGWQDKWNAIITQTDDNIRIDQIQQTIKTMAEQAMTIPIYETHSPWASNGKVNDIGFSVRKMTAFTDFPNLWLSK